MSKIPYDIGDWVKVNARITSHHETQGRGEHLYYHSSHKKLHRQVLKDEPDYSDFYRTVYGRVVGMVRRYEGKVTGSGGEADFQPTSNMLLIQVKPTWTGKIVEALPEDIEPAEPREFAFQGTISKEARKDWSETMKEESKDRPRDAKGRWTVNRV